MTATTAHSVSYRGDLISMMLHEHRALEHGMEQLRHVQSGRERESAVAALIADVHRYGRLVGDHLDPLVRRYVPNTPGASNPLDEYVEIARAAAQLRHDEASTIDGVLTHLVAKLTGHLDRQEQHLLPSVTDHVPAEVLHQRAAVARRGATIHGLRRPADLR